MTPQENQGDRRAPVVEIDLQRLYDEVAKLAELNDYVAKAMESVEPGAVVRLTGRGPVWLYLKLAHALHGKARTLVYSSPVTGDVTIFDHDPF